MPTYQFTNPRKVILDNYADLPPHNHAQMSISARLGFGKKYSTPVHFLEQSEDFVELWDVVDTANPGVVVYDAWIYLVDTGNIFVHGTDEDTGVGMIQWSFECLAKKSTPACEQLAEDIQAAFDAIEREDDEEAED